MATRKKKSRISRKPKIGSQGPTPAWLKLSVSDRTKLKAQIKAGFQGTEAVPGLRRVSTAFSAADGYDLRHIERWSSARIKKVREVLANISLFSNVPHELKIARTSKQKSALKNYTGQAIPGQKAFIVHKMGRERVRFIDGKVTLVDEHAKGRSVRRLYLLSDYHRGEPPATFKGIRAIVKRMLPAMPDTMKGRQVLYAVNTIPNGPVGNMVTKSRVLDLLTRYYEQYDDASNETGNHQGFVGAINGIYMSGTTTQIIKAVKEKETHRKFYKTNRPLKLYMRKPSTKGQKNVRTKKRKAAKHK